MALVLCWGLRMIPAGGRSARHAQGASLTHPDELRAAARAWIADDPDPAGRAELSALLADHLLRHEPDPGRRLLVTTVVSAGLLGRMAAAAGAGYAETLTGFKWIMRAAEPGRVFLFGYEEALGYAVTGLVRDKDGISAAVALAAAAEAKAAGGSLATRLDELACRFGLFATGQFAVDLAGGGRAGEAGAALLETARAKPPRSLDGAPVAVTDDYGMGLRTREDGSTDPLALPRSDVIIWRCADGTRVALRPSGTEPKVKVYWQVVLPAIGGLAPPRAQAARRLAELRKEVTNGGAEPLTTPRPEGRGFQPSPAGVPVSPPAAPGRTRNV